MSADTDDGVERLRERVVGHVRDDAEKRRALEQLAARGDDPIAAAARVIVALADGDVPDRSDVDAMLATTDAGRDPP